MTLIAKTAVKRGLDEASALKHHYLCLTYTHKNVIDRRRYTEISSKRPEYRKPGFSANTHVFKRIFF